MSIRGKKKQTKALTITEVEGPEAIAVNRRGEIVVYDYYGQCVSVFSPSGEKLQSFGTTNFTEGLFYNPCGITVDDEDNILLADKYNNLVQKFTAEGELLVSKGSADGINYSSDIAFNNANGRIYVGHGGYSIQILNSDLSYHGTFGEFGTDDGQFTSTCHIACDTTGNVYVVDGHSVQVFTAEGEFLRKFSGHSEGSGRPFGIAVDSNN